MVNLFTVPTLDVNAIEAITYVALGFAPTLVALEIAWKMGEKIGNRGKIASVVKAR